MRRDDTSEAFDTALKLCCDEHRRIILATLTRERRALTLNDLLKEIVRHNHHMPIPDVPSEEIDHIWLALSHHHVPKLVNAEVVKHDKARNLVEPTDRLDWLQPYLSTIIEADPGLELTEND